MKIILAKKTYDTSNSKSLKALRQVLVELLEDKTENAAEIKSVRRQIEKEYYVTDAEIAVYELIVPEVKRVTYKQTYIKQKETSDSFYSYVNGKFYLLPESDDLSNIPYVIITKYLYERQRHDETELPCASLRALIDKLVPKSVKKSDLYLEKLLKEQQIEQRIYFGVELSENSDSEAEEEFKAKSKQDKKEIKSQANTYINRAQKKRYESAIQENRTAPPPNFKQRLPIHRDSDFKKKRRQSKDDLKLINDSLKDNYQLSLDLIENLETKFVVAQYRGIHYFTSSWSAHIRRVHRKLNENGQAQFSSAIFSAADIESFDDYVLKLASHEKDEVLQELEEHATALEDKLIDMQYSGPVEYNGYVYLSLFHLVQYWYSSDYDGFPERVRNDLKKANESFLSNYLSSPHRPLLSTGDIPYHALRYAYGAKLYKGHEHQRLDPAYHFDGTVERPYSGKVYVSLHPIEDYTRHRPTHITSQFVHGLINLSNIISAERETSFLAYLLKDRVVLQHLAKFPSFIEYKNIYKSKYGLDREMFNKIQVTLAENPPHSAERARVIKILEEYFCAFQEVRLIEEAARIASDRGEVLIYRDDDGGFSLEPPDTPSTKVKRLHDFIMGKREQYAGESKTKTIKPLSNARRLALIPEEIAYPIDEYCREILTPK